MHHLSSMLFLELVCVLLYLKLCTAVTISDEDYKLLPQMYDMDDYRTCHRESNVYCKIKLVLMTKDRNSKLWHTIMDAKQEKHYMEHDVIYRARCIPREYFPDTDKVMTHITELENRNLENISFHAKVHRMNCGSNTQKFSAIDYLVLWLLSGYLILIIFATVVDTLSRRKKLRNDLSNHNIITALSVISNWESLRKPIAKADYSRLMCFQGLRILNICVVAGGHAVFVAGTMFTTNTRLIEDFLLSTFGRALINFTIHVIQSNFMISGWLHTIQVYDAAEKSDNKKLPSKVIAEKLIARYLSFVLHITFYIGIINLIKPYVTGPQTDFFEADVEACRTYWWGNLLLINNFFYVKNMCNFASWYLSCDLQAHAACMVLFYLMYKFNFGINFFGVILLFVGIINSYILYNAYEFHDIETVVVCPIRPVFTTLENVLQNDYGYFFHTSFPQNLSSYLVGILFGAIYYRHRNTKIKVTKVITVIWGVGFYGLPLLVIILSFYSYSPFTSAIIGSLLKPLFSLGISIGMLGMSHNIGGFAKRMCEARPLEFISRWVLSVYVFHPILIFYSLSMWMDMPELSYMFVIKVFSFNLILAITLGLVLHLIIERPLIKVISMIISKLMYKQKTK